MACDAKILIEAMGESGRGLGSEERNQAPVRDIDPATFITKAANHKCLFGTMAKGEYSEVDTTPHNVH